jgi:hypothetical protein
MQAPPAPAVRERLQGPVVSSRGFGESASMLMRTPHRWVRPKRGGRNEQKARGQTSGHHSNTSGSRGTSRDRATDERAPKRTRLGPDRVAAGRLTRTAPSREKPRQIDIRCASMGRPSLCEQEGQQRPPEHDGTGPDYEHEVVNALQHAATISATALTEKYPFPAWQPLVRSNPAPLPIAELCGRAFFACVLRTAPGSPYSPALAFGCPTSPPHRLCRPVDSPRPFHGNPRR